MLKKAGWVVPAVIALPLVPGTGHAHNYASGPKYSGGHSSGGHYDSSDWDDIQKYKKYKLDMLRKLLKKWFGR